MPHYLLHIVELLGYMAIGGAVATPLLLINVRVAPILGLIDWPKARGITEDHIPIVGHSLVLISVVALTALTYIYNLSPWVVGTATAMGFMGYLDDRKALPASLKMAIQFAGAAAVVYFDPMIANAITAKYGPLGDTLAVFFIVGLVNAVNFIDGIDGLAGLVLWMGALGFIGFAHGRPEQFAYFLYCALLMGMLVPFLYLNIVKRKGFLGNVGSYFFSYLLAVIHLSVPLASPQPIPRIALACLCFLIPVADSLMVIFSRILTMRSPFQADKGHLHHRLIQTSLALRYVLLNFALIELAGLLMAFLINRRPILMAMNLLPAFACASYVAISAILILMVEKASKRRVQHYFQRLDSGQPIYFLKYQIRRPGGNVSIHSLRRLEAQISAEIRVTDMCFSEKPNEIFVTISTLAEPLRGISERLDRVFQKEGVETTLVIDQGEFLKVSHRASTKKNGRKRA